MYAYLKGKVTERCEGYVIMDVGGLGFKVFTASNFDMTATTAYTHLHIREGIMDLYGFSLAHERDFFERLITVTGVGPKAALSLLSIMSVAQISLAILSDDSKSIARANGVGPKTAKRIILELKDKMKSLDYGAAASQTDADYPDNIQATNAETQAEEALLVLGYGMNEAKQALKGVDSSLSVEDKIKFALKNLV